MRSCRLGTASIGRAAMGTDQQFENSHAYVEKYVTADLEGQRQRFAVATLLVRETEEAKREGKSKQQQQDVGRVHTAWST